MSRSLPVALLLTGCAGDIDWSCDDPEGSGWDPGWEDLDLALFDATNAARAAGGDCPTGTFEPAPPLTFNSDLACAARGHALNKATNDFFEHDSLDGRDPGRRIEEAGYAWTSWAENIAAGRESAADTVQGWLDSDTGHCENLLNPDMVDGGFGYAFGEDSTYQHYWVQVFGTK